MKKEEFIRWNERMFKKYNNVRLYDHPNPLIRYTENKRVSILLDKVAKSGKVLDLGCGEGYILEKINSELVVGVDISVSALKRASGKATLVRADGEALPFSDSYFDAAICSEMIEHTRNPGKVVEELARVVRPGGKILISIPNEPLINNTKDLVWNLGLFGIVFPNVPRRQNDEWHLHSFDLGMLRRICKPLTIEKTYGVPFSFYPIRYIALCTNPKKKPKQTEKMFFSEVKKISGYYEAL